MVVSWDDDKANGSWAGDIPDFSSRILLLRNLYRTLREAPLVLPHRYTDVRTAVPSSSSWHLSWAEPQALLLADWGSAVCASFLVPQPAGLLTGSFCNRTTLSPRHGQRGWGRSQFVNAVCLSKCVSGPPCFDQVFCNFYTLLDVHWHTVSAHHLSQNFLRGACVVPFHMRFPGKLEPSQVFSPSREPRPGLFRWAERFHWHSPIPRVPPLGPVAEFTCSVIFSEYQSCQSGTLNLRQSDDLVMISDSPMISWRSQTLRWSRDDLRHSNDLLCCHKLAKHFRNYEVKHAEKGEKEENSFYKHVWEYIFTT